MLTKVAIAYYPLEVVFELKADCIWIVEYAYVPINSSYSHELLTS